MVWSTAFDSHHEQKDDPQSAPPRQLVAGNANRYLDHCRELDIHSAPAFGRLTGIICTIGPSSSDSAKLEKMIEAGMNIARLNFSHGSPATHLEYIRNIRTAVENYSKRLGLTVPVAIALDTKGPEIRLGYVAGGPLAEIEIKTGDQIKLTTDRAYYEKGSASVMYVDYENMSRVVQIGNRVYIDDGLIALICTNIQGSVLTCTIENGGILGGCKGVNLPGVDLDLPAISEKDREDILFAMEHELDIIFASYTREASAINEFRDLLGPKGKRIQVIAKIENQQGLQNIDEIIKVADGIMIGRGDLGIELPVEKLFLAQKSIIAKCNIAGKPVICTNQMLESMMKNPRPTRAESTDVANAVLDGVDCTVLTCETAKGQYPIESILMMSKICKEAESAIWYKQIFMELVGKVRPPLDPGHAVAIAAVEAATKCLAAAIVVVTATGKSAFLVAKYRPNCPIIAVSRYNQTARQLNLYRAIIPLVFKSDKLDTYLKDVETRLSYGISFGKWRGFIRDGDPVVCINGSQRGSGSTDTMRILYVTKTKAGGGGEPCTVCAT